MQLHDAAAFRQRQGLCPASQNCPYLAPPVLARELLKQVPMSCKAAR
jgi:hypothetical protein